MCIMPINGYSRLIDECSVYSERRQVQKPAHRGVYDVSSFINSSRINKIHINAPCVSIVSAPHRPRLRLSIKLHALKA